MPLLIILVILITFSLDSIAILIKKINTCHSWDLWRICGYSFSFSLVPRSPHDSGLGDTRSRTVGGAGYRRPHRSESSSLRRSDFRSTSFEDDMEEELEKTKVVKAFWDLRQEVKSF